MKKPLEQFPENNDSKELESEDLSEVTQEAELENKKEAKEENQEEKIELLEGLRDEIEGIIQEDPSPELEDEDSGLREPARATAGGEKIHEYRDRYLPQHLRKKAGFISKAITHFWNRWTKFETEGKENMPEKGPFLVISNHFGGGDAEAISRTFKDFDVHFGVAKEIWWNRNAIVRWALKKLRMIPVEESLLNIPEGEKEEALKRQDKHGKAVFRKIIDREREGGASVNVEFIRQAVAALSRGDAIAVFPEGLWLNPQIGLPPREKAEMKQGYAGFELLARQYKKLTGKDLPIIPTAFIEDRVTGKKKLVIGEQLLLNENETEFSNTDWCMANIAKLLPEEQRGYYKEIAKQLEE